MLRLAVVVSAFASASSQRARHTLNALAPPHGGVTPRYIDDPEAEKAAGRFSGLGLQHAREHAAPSLVQRHQSGDTESLLGQIKEARAMRERAEAAEVREIANQKEAAKSMLGHGRLGAGWLRELHLRHQMRAGATHKARALCG